MEELLKQYEKKFGKKPVGKWAKDEDWLKGKLGITEEPKEQTKETEKPKVKQEPKDEIPQDVREAYKKLIGETKAQYHYGDWILDTAKEKIYHA